MAQLIELTVNGLVPSVLWIPRKFIAVMVKAEKESRNNRLKRGCIQIRHIESMDVILNSANQEFDISVI